MPILTTAYMDELMPGSLTTAPPPGATLLYPMDDASGLTVHDRSGNGFNGTITASSGGQPVWDAHGLLWSGKGYVLIPPAAWPGTVGTIEIVLDAAAQTATSYPTPFSTDAYTWSMAPDGTIQAPTNMGGPDFGHGIGFASAFKPTGPNLFQLVLSNPMKLYINGVETPVYLEPQNAPPTLAAASGFLLGALAGVGRSWTGHIDGFALLPYQASHAQILADAAWWSNIVGVRGVQLGNTVPTTSAQVLDLGDSLVVGFNSTYGNDWPSVLQRALSSAPAYVNLGVGGITAATVATEAAYYATLRRQYSGLTAVNLQVGTNDIAQATGQATATINAITTAAAAFIAAGCKVNVATIISRGGGFAGGQNAAGFRTDQLAVNAGVAAAAGSVGYRVADLAADPLLGGPTAYTNAAIFAGDQTHLTDLGYAHEAAVFLPQVNAAGIH